MDRKTWVAIGLSALIFIGWQKFVLEKYQPVTSPTAAQQVTVTSKSVPSRTMTPETESAPVLPSLPVELSQGTVQMGSGSRVIEKWTYRPVHSEGSGERDVDMASLVGPASQLDLTVDLAQYGQMASLGGSYQKRSETEFRWAAENEAVKLVRDVQIYSKDGYADITYTAEFRQGRPNFAFVSLVSQDAAPSGEERDRQLVYFAGKQHHSVAASEPVELTDILLPVEWIGVENRYFILSVIDRAGGAKGLLQPLPNAQNRISLVYPVTADTMVIPVRVYFGPKSVDTLKSVHASLDHAVDFGWLTPLAYGILHFMKWLFSFLGNYGAAIILLTVILKILLYPLTYKSMKSMKKMSALQPQLQRIREKFKDDKEALNREMLQLMRSNGYNPVAGCLPMLIQMPVFFALYRVLYSSFELYQSPFAFWIQDLSKHDPWYVTPVILTGVMFLQQKLTPTTATDPAQQKMIQWMPVIFGVFMLGLPAGLTLYMLTNAVVSIVQQLVLNKKLGIYPAHAATKAR